MLPGPAVVTSRAKPAQGALKAAPTAVPPPPPANDDRQLADEQKPVIVTTASRKQTKLRGEPAS